MGLKASEWKAKWIGADPQEAAAPLLRKTFTINKKIRKAKAFICGLGFFELYMNGKRVGNDYLVPNLSNYTKREGLDKGGLALDDNFRAYRTLYMAYDVTDYLLSGRNAVGVILGNGFYQPDKSNAGFFGHPCLLCQIEMEMTDGSKQTIVTDDSWLTKPSAIHMNGIYYGEIYNANDETNNWSTSSLKEDGWKPANLVEGPKGQLTAQTSPSDKIMEILHPISLNKLADGHYEVDFGKEIAGWIHFKNITGQKGDTLRVNYVCESPQGTQNYVFKGEKQESYAPRFTWFAFSKAIISGVKDLTANQLQAEAVNTDVPISSYFHTSNSLFNKINTIWRRSQMDNMHGCVASDCPHRERLPYTGDGEAACATVMLNFDAASFYQKWIRDVRDAQNKETGYVPNSAPWQPGCGGGVPWGAAMNVMPWEYYLQYGDKKLLQDSYFAMKEQVRYMLTWLTPDGIMFQKKTNVNSTTPNYWFNLGDWCPPYGLPKDELVHTFYLWLCSDYTAKAAKALGNKADETYYETLAEKVRQAFNKHFYDNEAKTYGDFGSNIFALKMGVPEEKKNDVIASLKKEIMESHQGHINTGFLGTKYFFEVLTDNGLNDVAYTAMNKTDFPSYGHWIAQGATTTWEQWDGGNSHNHPMFGSGLTWFYRRLAGVNVDENEPGYRHIIFRPEPVAQLDSVDYSLQTPYGKVASEVLQHQGQTQINVTVPVGSYATLYLPTKKIATITESGTTLAKAKCVKLIGNKNGKTCVQLQQGSFHFSF
jgi:alpha-L-rhamnosidase